jgi:hypothetical protein
MSSTPRHSRGFAWFLLALAAPVLAQMPVDDFRVRQLESEVQRLQRQVDDQSRRIAALEYAANIPTTSQSFGPVPRENTSPSWLVAASWDRVKPGMKVAEVIAILGRPTSTRNSDDGKLRLMYYAMEMGAGGILSGTIRFEDAGVVEINRPVLK